MMHNKTKTVLKIVKQNIALCIGLLIVVIGAVILSLLPPLILERLINKLSMGIAITFAEALFYFGILVLVGIIDAGREVMITKLGQIITRVLRQFMCEKLDRLSAGFYTEHATGRVVSLFTGDVDTIQSLFSNGIISMVVDSFQIISILIVIFVKSPGLGMMMLVVIPLLFLMTRVFQKRMLQAQLSNRAAIAKVTNHIPETIRSIRTIQNLMKQRFMEEKYDDYISESYHAVEKSNWYDSIYSPIVLFISSVMIALVMVLSSLGGGWRALFGMSVGTAVAVIAYIGKIFTPIESLGMEIQNIQEALAGVKRVTKFLEEPEEVEKITYINEQDRLDNKQSIEFHDVNFGYDADSEVLNHVSFAIQSGENVTLAGRTGCGKSTIFKLILGLYAPDQGSVSVFGKEAYKLANQQKRSLFGYVEQSFHLIEGSVADQITLGDHSISMEQIQEAAKLTGLHDVIMDFPEQYAQRCTTALFSQGQFQLLSIARAVVSNPSIMLLDEITANLDSETEKEVLEALRKAGEHRTVISISHRIYEQSSNSRLIDLTSVNTLS